MPEKKDKLGLYPIPADFMPELSDNARKLYSRLLVLTDGGRKECVYKTSQAAKELGFTARTCERQTKALRDAGLINSRVEPRSSWGINVRMISVVPDKVPANCAKKYPPKSPTEYPTEYPPKSPTEYPTEYPPKSPTEYPTEYPPKSPTVADTFGGKVPAKVADSVAGTLGAVKLDLIGAEFAFPYLFYKNNKELLIIESSRARSLAPQLFTETTHFDLRCLVQQLDGKFAPFGEPHNGVFDFSPLLDMYGYTNLDALKDKPAEYWRVINENNEKYWREFFVMSVLIELTCYGDQLFTRTDKCNPNGRNFKEFYFTHQYSMLFKIINTVYASDSDDEYDGIAIFNAIRDKYNPISKGASLLKFASGVIKRQVLNTILPDPDECELAYRHWRAAFFRSMNVSYPNWTVKHLPHMHEEYCTRYFDPDIARFLLNDEEGFRARFICPTLLFRRIVCCHGAARMSEDGPNEMSTQRVIWFLEALHNKPQNRELWDHLCDNLADAFPFMREPGVFDHV